ncbi:ATP-binding cassette domain-containing protein [Aeromicrobium endophyticum]|uniref:ATP-binding cassette domain-containing protein n=1 Tax=Aeromicrobium endophyticum TaxID=2292704 RepID=A0A371PBN9_9ACTN|nr:ATP-binding cassette domain-containing protein [Aeromicrobium endophyticum]REK73351.1 ATP-binding cassette domain-containing protein [Aeromicrobium endophyticum]
MSTKHSTRPRLIRRELRRDLVAGTMLIAAATLVPTFMGNLFWQQAMLLAAVYVIAAVGLDVLRSQAEQMSFGQGAVLGVAAYVAALANGVWEKPLIVAAGLGLAAGMVTGMLMALPSLRVQSYYLGFVTLAGALALPDLIIKFKDQTQALTGVNVFLDGINEPLVGSLNWLTIGVTLLAVLAIFGGAVLRSSGFGRAMLLAGESPEAAVTVGLRPGQLRLQAFALSSFAASVAGVCYVGVIQYVGSGSFTLALSVMLYFVVIVGGPGKVLGPILGVVLLYIVPDHLLAGLLDYRLLIYGTLVLVVMLVMPEGIAGGLDRLLRKLSKRSDDRSRTLISLAPILAAAPRAEVSESDEARTPLLVVDDVRRSFGSVKALDGASMTVERGTVHAIVGPNGSGKTTLLNAISGLISVDSGTVELEGRDITSTSASARARLGLGRTFQQPRVLDSLSVWENIDCGRRSAHQIEWFEEAIAAYAAEWDTMNSGVLPHGQRRFVEVLRALHAGPSLVALDEPAAGLSHGERLEFGQLLRDVAKTTTVTVLIVEHDLDLVWNIADTITVVDGGRVIASGTPAELRNSTTIAHLFVGVDHVAG